MKRPRLAIPLASVFVFGWAGGILFEHYVGVNALLDWASIDHWQQRYHGRAVRDRVPVPWPAAARGRTMVALVFGQSNAGNSGETTSGEHRGVYEFYRGRVYDARDPLLEASGNGGSIWMRLGARLVESGQYDTVVLVPFALGSTAIQRWAPEGNLHGWLLSVIAQAHASGLKFTHLLWQQGEADAMAGTPAEGYKARFGAMLDSIRAAGVDAPIFVARTTICGKHAGSDELRAAQGSLADPARGIRAGPDTDTLGRALRYDGCHFSTDGLDRAAELWQQALAAAGTNGTSSR